MNGRRAVCVLRGAISLVATLALLAGVPFLLAMWVGRPLPRSIPTLDALEQATRSGISDQVVVKALAVVAWIAWAQLALALVVETLAVARGRQAIHLPVLPGFQVTAARLVTGILMIASTVQPARAQAAPAPISVLAEFDASRFAPTVEVFGPGVDDDGPMPIASTTDPTAPARAVEHPSVTVRRHDTYWAIAERTLGDGFRWREILDLNVGRILPDGSTIAAGDETLHAGWVLLLPAGAAADSAVARPSDGPAPTVEADQQLATIVVERGDNLWTISEDRLEVDLGREPTDPEVAPYWREIVDANQDRYVQPGNPNLIYPGQVLVLPPTGREPPAPPPDELATRPAEPPPPAATPEEVDQPAGAPVTSTTIAGPAESESPPPPPPPPPAVEEPARVTAEDADVEDD